MWAELYRFFNICIGHLNWIVSRRTRHHSSHFPYTTTQQTGNDDIELGLIEASDESRVITEEVEHHLRRLPQGKLLDLRTILSSLYAPNSECEETEILTLVASEKYFVPEQHNEEEDEGYEIVEGDEEEEVEDEEMDFEHLHLFMLRNSDVTLPIGILSELHQSSKNVPYVEVEDPPANGHYITREPLSLIYELTTRYDMQMNFPQQRLHIHRLDALIVQMLKLRFPKVRTLEIVDHGLETIIDHLCAILEHYADQLVHLKIVTLATQFSLAQPLPANLNRAWAQLERTINEHCVNLRHLTIYDPLEKGPLMVNLGNLVHLEELNYSFRARQFRDIIRHLEQFSRLKRFGCLCPTNPTLEPEFDLDGLEGNFVEVFTILSKLTRLIYPDIVYQEGLVQRSPLFSKLGLFSSLNALSLTQCSGKFYSSVQFQLILSGLALLPRLTQLRITYHPEMMIDWIQIDPTDLIAFPVLPQIEFLHLDCSFCPHKDILFIGSTFPNLKFLTITGYYLDCIFAEYMFDHFRQYFCTGEDIEQSTEMLCCEERVLCEIRNNKQTHFSALQKVTLFKYSEAFHLFLNENADIYAPYIIVNFEKIDTIGNPRIEGQPTRI